MIGVKLLDRLQELHAINIAHCDLKPENITIGFDDPSELYLIDFGLSKTIPDEILEPLKIGHIVGTPNYINTVDFRKS